VEQKSKSKILALIALQVGINDSGVDSISFTNRVVQCAWFRRVGADCHSDLFRTRQQVAIHSYVEQQNNTTDVPLPMVSFETICLQPITEVVLSDEPSPLSSLPALSICQRLDALEDIWTKVVYWDLCPS
jgi:hypothetical protein